MPKPVPLKETAPDLLPESEYRLLFEGLESVSTIILFEIESSRFDSRKDLIIRNFVARGTVTLQSIFQLWTAKAYGDCWALFRILLDRFFHLHVLSTKNEFQSFEEWSFIREYEMNNNVWSDRALSAAQKAVVPKPTAEEKKRYKELKGRGAHWKEPKAEAAAKSFGVPVLYKFGYDYASRFLHPSATDGLHEFELLTNLGGKGDRGDQRLILHNSALTHAILLNEALGATSLEWRALIYDCIDGIVTALKGDSSDYRGCLLKIVAAGPDHNWCRRKAAAE